MFLLGLIVIALIVFLNAAPLAFFAMLFLGNFGVHASFLAFLPGAVAVKFISHNIISAPTPKS